MIGPRVTKLADVLIRHSCDVKRGEKILIEAVDKSIHVSIEHGHANKLGNDYSIRACYYLSERAHGGPSFPAAEQRLPPAR